MKFARFNQFPWFVAVCLLLVQPLGFGQGNGAVEGEGEGALPNINPVQMELLRQAPGTFRPGTMMDINVTILVSQANPRLTALGLRETLPDGWVFAALRGVNGQPPAVQPQPGDMGMLEFAWITPPNQFPYTIAYTVEVPPEAGGKQFFSGQLVYRQFEGELLTAPVITSLEGPDNKPPKVTLQGDNPLVIEQGTPFVEPGYTATDETDGDVSASVQVSGVVNSQVPGNYTLTYTATDKSGNQSTPVTREVEVVVAENDGPGPVAGNPNNSNDNNNNNTNRRRNFPRQRFGGVPRTTALGGESQERALDPGGPEAAQADDSSDTAENQPATDLAQRMDEARARQAAHATRAAEQQALIEARRQEALDRASQGKTIRINRSGGDDASGPMSAVARRVAQRVEALQGEDAAETDGTAYDQPEASGVAPETPVPVAAEATENGEKDEDAAFEETEDMQLAQADSPTPAATVATVKTPPAGPGMVERLVTSLANLDTSAILRLAGILMVGVAVLVFAYVAYRGAYRSTPRRQTSGKSDENDAGSEREAQHQA